MIIFRLLSEYKQWEWVTLDTKHICNTMQHASVIMNISIDECICDIVNNKR